MFKSYIGMGYHPTLTPNVILRNVLENPGWYTAYTPYQPEIAQGRLEALLNFQQISLDLTGMELASASLLDEATAAAEAMALAKRVAKSKANTYFIADDVHPQTIDVVRTRAEMFGFDVIIGKATDAVNHDVFGALLQYPPGQAEITGVRIEIAPGSETGWHLHPVPSFGVMLQGQLEIKLKNGKKNVVKAGDALAEVVNTAHSGKNIGTEPVQLLIFYAG